MDLLEQEDRDTEQEGVAMVVVGVLFAPFVLGWHVIIITGIIAVSGYIAKVLGMLFFGAEYSAAEFWYWGFDHWTFGMVGVFLWYTGVKILQYTYTKGASTCTSCLCGDEHTINVDVTRDELDGNPELAALLAKIEKKKARAETKGNRMREATMLV